jgi:hypothetical protein
MVNILFLHGVFITIFFFPFVNMPVIIEDFQNCSNILPSSWIWRRAAVVGWGQTLVYRCLVGMVGTKHNAAVLLHDKNTLNNRILHH